MTSFPLAQWHSLTGSISAQTYKTLRFLFYVIIIYGAHMSTAILTEKIYKTPYQRNIEQGSSEAEPGAVTVGDYFGNPFGIPIFTSFFGMFYGLVKYEIINSNSDLREQHGIPWLQSVRLAGVDVTISVLIEVALILTSFATVNLFNCCNLLAVVLFALIFSRGSEETGNGRKVGKRQTLVAVVITIGILVYNMFAEGKQTGVDKPLGLGTLALIAFILLLQGYRPQLATQIKQKYSPPPSLLLYQVSKYSFMLLLLACLVSGKLFSMLAFIWEHDRLALDLMLHATLNVVGLVFIYRIIVLHKQHVVPMVTTVRKLLTNMVNLAYFHHTIGAMQYVGLAIVGVAVLAELYANYLENFRKFKEVHDTQDPPNIML